jgi:translation initiation factor IF-1
MEWPAVTFGDMVRADLLRVACRYGVALKAVTNGKIRKS